MTVLAVVSGNPVTEMPVDLFIPPDALEVLLDSFSGPLDFLLYLIRKQDLDIMNIPMVLITRQYLHYIELLEARQIELAADYLVMAAVLAEIKSRMLLPRPSLDPDSEEDPRMTLVRRLQAYEKFKQAARGLDALPRRDRDIFQAHLPLNCQVIVPPEPDVSLHSLVLAFSALLEKETNLTHHAITREPLSVRERMSTVLQRLQQDPSIEWTTLLTRHEGRMGLIVTVLAILELAKQSLIRITQPNAFASIYLRVTHDE